MSKAEVDTELLYSTTPPRFNMCYMAGPVVMQPRWHEGVIKKDDGSTRNVCTYQIAAKNAHARAATTLVWVHTYGEMADCLGKYLHKGDYVFVAGPLRLSQFHGSVDKRMRWHTHIHAHYTYPIWGGLFRAAKLRGCVVIPKAEVERLRTLVAASVKEQAKWEVPEEKLMDLFSEQERADLESGAV